MKFEVYKDGKLDTDYRLGACYLFGGDTVALSSANKIEYNDGLIVCTKRSSESAGLALLWEVQGFGKVMLPTTCLPAREKPYNLNLELARAKLMQITLKREDWAVFEETPEQSRQIKAAMDFFINAVKHIDEPGKAASLADQSLFQAMAFSEAFAVRHGEHFLSLRTKSRNLGKHTLGCVINPSLMANEHYRKSLLDLFGFVTIPINWAKIEKEKGQFDFTYIDKCIDHLAGRRVAVSAGPLVRFRKDMLPPWLLDKKRDFGKLREACYHFISTLVHRYRNYVHTWRVISGMNCENLFGMNFEQAIEMTRAACLAAKSAESRSRKVVELIYPWGEYYSVKKETVPPLIYVDTVIQSGISFDAFGLQLNFGLNKLGMHLRDMMQLSSKLDSFVPVPKPLHITEVSVPDGSMILGNTSEQSGIWHHEWDQQLQSEWIEQFYKVALGKPFVNSVTYANLADGKGILVPGSGLLTEDFKPKKSYVALAKIQKAILRK